MNFKCHENKRVVYVHIEYMHNNDACILVAEETKGTPVNNKKGVLANWLVWAD